MNPITLTRNQRRQLEKVAGRMMQADAKFFERRPDRHYRIRLAHSDEIEERRIVDGWQTAIPIPDGKRAYIAVNSPLPGIRFRMPFLANEGMETDVSEEIARGWFKFATGGKFA
jgi:hypothetical protein